jgi:hypothetical protein
MKKGFFSLFRSQSNDIESKKTERAIKIPIKIYEQLMSIAQKQNKTMEELIEENPLLLAQIILTHNRNS